MWRAVLVAVMLIACSKKVIDPISGDVDPADPKSVVGAVFYAAQTGDHRPLAGLCAPDGASEVSVRRLCGLIPTSAEWPSFVRMFARARLNGEPRVSGDHAALNFVFGERGATSETMELARRGGRWYLLRF